MRASVIKRKEEKIMTTNQKPRRIKILGLYHHDACYKNKERFIGRTGIFTPDIPQHTPGYFAGFMKYDNVHEEYPCDYFYAIRYKRI